MTHFTLEDLLNFTQKEKEMVQDITPITDKDQRLEPGAESIRNILAYNKALSIRKSEFIPSIRIVLN